MKFVTEVATKYSGRLGTLLQPESGQKYQTPLIIHSTKGGSIPHLSKEVFNYVTTEPQILQISLSTTVHMDEALKLFKNGIAQFVGFKDSPIFVNFKDPSENAPSGFNEKDIVPMFTRSGKQAITAERYMNLIEGLKPDIYHTLCDADTNEQSAKKRIQKSIDRTDSFFDICIERHKKSETLSKSLLIAPIVGGYNKFSRSLSIKSMKAHSEIGGYIIEGLHNYGDTAMSVNVDSLKDIVGHCMTELPVDKLKVMFGAYCPVVILEMIQLGVDIFDTSYIYIASQNFRALTFSFDQMNNKNNVYCVDLNDDRYKDDFTPFLNGCFCLACQKHTKAYVHHLIKTRELLAPILMMIHNTHHYLQFFEAIKEAIKKDEIPTLKDFIKSQLSEGVDEKKLIVDEKSNIVEEKPERLKSFEPKVLCT